MKLKQVSEQIRTRIERTRARVIGGIGPMAKLNLTIPYATLEMTNLDVAELRGMDQGGQYSALTADRHAQEVYANLRGDQNYISGDTDG